MYNGRSSVSFSYADRGHPRIGIEPQRNFSFQHQKHYEHNPYEHNKQESFNYEQQHVPPQVANNQQYHNRYPDYSLSNNSYSTIQMQQSLRRQQVKQNNSLNKIPELRDESDFISMKYLMSPLAWFRIAQIVKFFYRNYFIIDQVF
jgi:hypothetical protein